MKRGTVRAEQVVTNRDHNNVLILQRNKKTTTLKHKKPNTTENLKYCVGDTGPSQEQETTKIKQEVTKQRST